MSTQWASQVALISGSGSDKGTGIAIARCLGQRWPSCCGRPEVDGRVADLTDGATSKASIQAELLQAAV